MRWRRARLALLAAALIGCGASPAQHEAVHPAARDDVRFVKGLPRLALVAREGDPRAAVAAAVTTGGIAPERGAAVAAALGALVEGRLEARGIDASVVPGWDGYRVRALLEGPTDAARLVDALRGAMLAPVVEADMARVRKKLAALAARPLRDPALLPLARCTGEAFGPPRPDNAAAASPSTDGTSARTAASSTPADVEAWRRAAHGTGRVAVAVAGETGAGEEVARALARAGTWPDVGGAPAEPPPTADAVAAFYDAAGEVAAGTTRAVFAVPVPRASQALAAAAMVGDPRGPLVTRLGALDAPARVRDVVATARPGGGCLAVTIDIAEGASPASAGRIATAVALARQELVVEVDEAALDDGLGRSLARRAADPRDAADRAAWWALTDAAPAGRAAGSPTRVATAIGVVGARDAPGDASTGAAEEALRSALDRATVAWHEPVVDARKRVEKGQGELWVLVGSPCGTAAEAEYDAGSGAAVALAAARDDARDVRVEPWIAADGIGLVAHAAAAPGETPAAHARRVADAAARAFAADALDAARLGRARGHLLGASEQDEPHALAVLADALAPEHPSWVAPLGTPEALGRASDLSLAIRASALRAGPLRVAVIANVDASQADVAVRATDRWVARRPGEGRACPAPVAAPAPRPGTYPLDAVSGATAAHIGIPLPAGDAGARAAATVVARALDGPDGLLAKALGAGLARGWSARVLGGPRAAALVVTVTTAAGALDAAVAQTRALLDQLRQGALSDADRARALSTRARADLAVELDPRARLVSLWRGEPASPAPPLDALRAFCASTLRDDALVIVALRPRPVLLDRKIVAGRDDASR